MTTPPFPLPSEIVPGGDPPAPQPPADPPAPPAPGPPAPPADANAELRAALDSERRQHRETRDQLAAAQRQGMTADQRRLEDARAEGRQAAIRENGARVAAEAFRAAAKGRLPDPAAVEAALEALDMTRFVRDDGEVDRDGLASLVDKLTPAGPAGPRIPAGPGGGPGADGDFLRNVMRGR